MKSYFVVENALALRRVSGRLAALGAAFLVLAWGHAVQAQNPNDPVAQIDSAAGLDSPQPAGGEPLVSTAQTAEPEKVAQMAAGLEAVVRANTDPQALAAAIADFVAEACLGGNCAAATRAALTLAAASPAAASSPTASAIGSALAQVANATREIRPDIAQAIADQIASPPSGADDALTSFNAVASIAVDDVVSTATIGTPGSGA